MTLSEKIALLRKQNGLSQEEFADKFNITRQAVQKWESGQSMPDVDNLRTMSVLFGVSVDILIDPEAKLPTDAVFSEPIDNRSQKPKPYGDVIIGDTKFDDYYQATREEYVTPSEEIELKVKERKRIRHIAFDIAGLSAIIFFIMALIPVFQSSTLVFIPFIFLAVAFVSLIFALLYSPKTKEMMKDTGWFYKRVGETMEYFTQKGYWYQQLEYDRLIWMFYNPAKKTFGLYFNGNEQFVCPIQNYVDFTVMGMNGGITRGSNSYGLNAVVGDFQGVGVSAQPTYVSQECTSYGFKLSYVNRAGELNCYDYMLHTRRLWHSYHSLSFSIEIKMRNDIAYSITNSYNDIKTKLEFEKKANA